MGVTPLPPLGAVTSVSQLQNHWCPHGGAGGGGAVTNNNPLKNEDEIFLTGGTCDITKLCGHNRIASKKTFVYKASTNSWRQLTDMPTTRWSE